MKNKITEFLGWYGVLAILLAYGLSSFDIITNKDVVYLLLNLTGGLGIIVDALDDKNYQPVILNIIWTGVALVSIIRLIV